MKGTVGAFLAFAGFFFLLGTWAGTSGHAGGWTIGALIVALAGIFMFSDEDKAEREERRRRRRG